MAKVAFGILSNQASVGAAANRLRARGHEVDIIADGNLLVDYLLNHRPDVLFVGFLQSRVDFPTVHAEVGKRGGTINAKVVLATLLKVDDDVA